MRATFLLVYALITSCSLLIPSDKKAAISVANYHGDSAVKKKEFHKAERHYKKACFLGNFISCNNVGHALYQQGKKKEAQKWYKKACDKDVAVGCFNLAEGISSLQAYFYKRKKLYTKSCDLGFSEACYVLGLRVLRHSRKKLNGLKRAKELLKKSCESVPNHVEACLKLATLGKSREETREFYTGFGKY